MEVPCIVKLNQKQQLELKKKQRWTAEIKRPKQNSKEMEIPNWKCKNNKVKHEHKKRRKEGEEKAHEDGRMVGWSRHLEVGDSKMSVQAATWGNQRTLKIRPSEEGTKLSNSLSNWVEFL